MKRVSWPKLLRAADLFCGAGGMTEGALRAFRKLGFRVDMVAANHWVRACITHSANHPEVRHLCADIDSLNPRSVGEHGSLDIMLAAPECTNHSPAKGGMSLDDQSRATAWCVARQIEYLLPDVVLMENVPAWWKWGPCIWRKDPKSGEMKWRPDPQRLGDLRRAWIACVEAMGYEVDARIFCAADYGVPTIRKRLIIQAVRVGSGKKITWPEPTHTNFSNGVKPEVESRRLRKPLRTTLAGRSDPFAEVPVERPAYNPKNKGTPDTAGIRPRGRTERATTNLRPWRAAWECIDFTLPCPSVLMSAKEAKAYKKRTGVKIVRPLAAASNRRAAKGVKKYVMDAEEPFILVLTHGGRDESVNDSFKTVTGAHRGERALVMPLLSYAQNGGGARSIEEPVQTVCANSKDQNQVLAAFVARADNSGANGSCTASPNEPLSTATTGTGHAVYSAFVARQFGTAVGHDVREPSRSATAGAGGGHSQVISAFVAQHNLGAIARAAEDPLATVTTRGTQQQLVAVSLGKYYGVDQDPQLREPLHTVTTKDRFCLQHALLDVPPLTPERAVMARRVAAYLRANGIVFEGEFARTRSGLVIYDIGMRLFIVPELAAAQGFPRDFVFTGTKTDQVKQIGNAVPPGLAEALVLAVMTQKTDVSRWLDPIEERMAA